jgi:hypothetical protein
MFSSPNIATIPSNDLRFQALSQLATEGVEEAVSDLWHEYGVDWSQRDTNSFRSDAA